MLEEKFCAKPSGCCRMGIKASLHCRSSPRISSSTRILRNFIFRGWFLCHGFEFLQSAAVWQRVLCANNKTIWSVKQMWWAKYFFELKIRFEGITYTVTATGVWHYMNWCRVHWIAHCIIWLMFCTFIIAFLVYIFMNQLHQSIPRHVYTNPTYPAKWFNVPSLAFFQFDTSQRRQIYRV